MTENFYLIGFVVCFLWGLFLIWRNWKTKQLFKLANETTDGAIKGLIGNINRLEEENKALKQLSTPPASESPKKVDWEPDDYNDLSAGKYERFNSDDLDEVSHMLTDNELRKFGG